MDNLQQKNFDAALCGIRDGLAPAREDLVALLHAKDDQCDRLYAAARDVRRANFGDGVFAYGFVYFSTYCRNNCTFCFYRKDNEKGIRYRKQLDEILQITRDLVDSGVHLIDLTMGEDPLYVGTEEGHVALMNIASAIKAQSGLPVMLSPGVLSPSATEKAVAAGIDWYACYQETHRPSLFARLRAGQDYDWRWNSKVAAIQAGMLVEEGILVGVGESAEDIADSILAMKELGAAQVRVMSFVPQEGAPLREQGMKDLYRLELNTIALLRLTMPDRLIPASLDVAGLAGLAERLNAGANVVTSIIAPKSGLAGVSNAVLDVDNGCRSVSGIADTLRACGLHLAEQEEYANTLERLHASYSRSQRVH